MNPFGLAALGGALWWLSRVNRNPTGAGFRDKSGRFHPIRSSEWYQPSLLDQSEAASPASPTKQATVRTSTAPRRLQATSASAGTAIANNRGTQEASFALVAKVEQARKELREREDTQAAESRTVGIIETEWEAVRQLEQTLRRKEMGLADDFRGGLYAVADPLLEVAFTGNFANKAKNIGEEFTDRAYSFPPTKTDPVTGRGSYAAGYLALLMALPNKLDPLLVHNKETGGPFAVRNHEYMRRSLEVAAKKLKVLKAWDATNKKHVEAVELSRSFADRLNTFSSYGEGYKLLEAARDKVRTAEAAAEAVGIRFLADRAVIPGDAAGEAELETLRQRDQKQHEAYLAGKHREASAKLQKELANEQRWVRAVQYAEQSLFDAEEMRSSDDKPGSKNHRLVESRIGTAQMTLSRLKAQDPTTYAGT